MSIFRSQVLDVPGPNNRLEQQADGVLNLGADYRLSSMPLRLSGNINWTPGFSTRLSDDKEVFQGDKLVADASALWIFNPSLQLRLSASNFLPRKYPTGGTVLSNTLAGLPTRDMTLNNPPSYVNYQARLELKL
jgi:iron complex outermembrane receptor protein